MPISDQKRITEALESLVQYMGAGSIGVDSLLEINKISKNMDADQPL
ncbi:MAG: hypothetical protein WCX65_10760 [bacterium]